MGGNIAASKWVSAVCKLILKKFGVQWIIWKMGTHVARQPDLT